VSIKPRGKRKGIGCAFLLISIALNPTRIMIFNCKPPSKNKQKWKEKNPKTRDEMVVVCFSLKYASILMTNIIMQDPQNKNLVNCDEKLKSILLGKSKIDLAELPALIKLHFPKESKWYVQLHYSRQGALHPLLWFLSSSSLQLLYVVRLRTLALFLVMWSER